MKFGKSIWHAKRTSLDNAEIATYDKPYEIVTRPNYISVMQATTRGYMEVLKYGESLKNTWTVIANSNVFCCCFKRGDVLWVDGEKPNEEIEEKYGYGASANAVVKNVAEVNATLSITLERNQNQIFQ